MQFPNSDNVYKRFLIKGCRNINIYMPSILRANWWWFDNVVRFQRYFVFVQPSFAHMHPHAHRKPEPTLDRSVGKDLSVYAVANWFLSELITWPWERKWFSEHRTTSSSMKQQLQAQTWRNGRPSVGNYFHLGLKDSLPFIFQQSFFQCLLMYWHKTGYSWEYFKSV